MRALVDHLYNQVSRMAGALASPKRLQLIELLCQCERSVETLADQARISVKLTSAHLKVLRIGGLVESRKEGKYVIYRLASPAVSHAWINIRSLARERLAELQMAMQKAGRAELRGVDRETILRKARTGEILILDVRPEEEFSAAHLKYARSLPLAQIRKHLKNIPRDIPIVAYCRGPFCMMASQAVGLMRERGMRAFELEDGVMEWQALGLPVESGLNAEGSAGTRRKGGRATSPA